MGKHAGRLQFHRSPIARPPPINELPPFLAGVERKLARVVDVFAKRLQTQETMTAQIAETIDKALKPKGVAVMIEAVHQCMSIRGVKKPDVATITTQFTGVFRTDPTLRQRFLDFVNR